MRRYLVWSVVLHAVILLGGALIAPMRGFGGSIRPTEVITVGLVDYANPAKVKTAPAQIPVPNPAADQPIPVKPAQDQTPAKVKPKPEIKKPPKKQEEKPPKLANADSANAVSGKLSEGAQAGDIWGVETGANVNPYHRQGFASIRANWRNPIVGAIPRKCVVRFLVRKTGDLTDITLEQSSGLDIYDRAALRAVTLTRSWPQFPDSWEEDEQIIHLEFEYRP
ncbi:MAG: TonB family protein [candidate division Zixibacteria bacterium]|nr:TonB family protein [candidate division Zixibacteria bacterium]